MRFLRLNIAILLTFFTVAGSYAQEADEVFGKNKVQYKNFRWNYIISKHFRIYYYQGGNELAHNAARFAEEDLERITSLIGFDVDEGRKITLIIYNSKIDLQQSNIGIEQYNLIGGETKLIKTKVEIPFPGTQIEFKKEISTQITKLLVNIMMYGGSLKDMVQNSYLFNLPDWFVEGVAHYVGYGWDAQFDNEIRNFDLSNIKKPSFVDVKDAKLIGHSVWAFIADKYGESSISNILHITGIVKNVETGISSSLAVSYTNFNAEWKNYYSVARTNTIVTNNNMVSIDLEGKKKSIISDVKISPDKSKIAYTSLFKGKHRVYVYDIASKETKLVLKGGAITPSDKVQEHTPLLSWKTNNILGMVHYKKGYLELIVHNVKNDDEVVIPFTRFEQIISFDFSDDGEFIIFSAIYKGRTDLYEYEYNKAKMTPLTVNLFDELDVQYLPLSYDIAFSSNRLNDTVDDKLGYFHQISDNFELFIYEHGNPVLQRLTYSHSGDYNPNFLDATHLFYNKQYGQTSYLYQYNLEDNSTIQVTDDAQAILTYDVVGDAFALVRVEDEKYVIRYQPAMKWEAVDTPQKLVDDAIDTTEPKVKQYSTVDDINIDSLLFASDVSKEIKDKLTYDAERQSSIWLSFPHDYEGLFGAEQVTSSFLIDQLRGTGVLLDVSMTEMMGDHFIKAGVFGLTDLKSSNFFGEYRYLKRREDYYLKYDKVSIFAISNEAAHRYTSNTFDLNIAYPLNVSNRLVFSPFFTSTRYVDMNVLSVPDVVQNYVGYGLVYVFDNTQTHGLNMIEGTRAKVYWNNYINVSDKDRSFGKLKIDIRHYQKIHRDITLAGRFSSGMFLGKSKKSFLLGGVDNWLFSKTYFPEDGQSPLSLELLTDNSDLLFLDYATGMRGFSYSQRFGSKYFLINGELRVPLVKYLHRSPVSSTFFRNLQLVGFYDFGASWSGSSPFSSNNSFNTQVVGGNGNPFVATVTNYRNPFLAAYGIGARTVLLGYYVKLDVAWGIENFTIMPPVTFLSFGYDF